jgi:hypothetical protein
MSIEKFLNTMKLQASVVGNAKASSAIGTVIAFDQANYYVNCEIYPSPDEGGQSLTTGWIPLATIWCGNGFGFFAPPSIGDLVLIEYQEGSFQNAIASMRFFQLGQNLNVPSGEAWVVHSSGSYIKFTNDGEVLISGAAEVNVEAPIVNVNSGSVNLGDLESTLTGLMNDVAISVYNSHTHNISSPGVTDAPNQPLDGSALTTNVHAN